MSIFVLAQVGGVLALLTLLHFLADWVLQSHAEAMAKPSHHGIRARHCLIYTVLCCVPLYFVASPSPYVLGVSAGVLFVSHFLEDTYLLVFLWAKYLRRPPEMAQAQNIETFKEFSATALGKILLITIDQLVHILFLLPVAVMLVIPSAAWAVTRVSIDAIGLLAALVLWGSKELKG